MKKLAIVTTHPIQYNAPFFKLLTERNKVLPKVFYTWPQAIDGFNDPDFGKKIQWDIPLLVGYDWEAVENISRHPSSKNWRGIDCPELNQRIIDFNPDAVFIYGWNLKSHFQAMRYFKGRLPVWFFGDSTLLDESAIWKRIIRRIGLRWIYDHVDKAFYVGASNRAYFEAHNLKQEQLIFFPHAIDNQRFTDSDEFQYGQKAKSWRKKLGYMDHDIVVLFSGKLEPKKNPEVLIEAVQLLNRSANKQIKLLFVGDGPLEPELRTKCANIDFVKFLPFQNQSLMPLIYRMGNLYCLPSKGPGESWGLAVNEAMACHRPVLVSDRVGCGADLVKHMQTGAIFHTNSKEDLAFKLKSLLRLDLNELGIKANKLITNWSFNSKCDAIEQNLLEL